MLKCLSEIDRVNIDWMATGGENGKFGCSHLAMQSARYLPLVLGARSMPFKPFAFRNVGSKLVAVFSAIFLLFAVLIGFVFYKNERDAVENAVSLNAIRLASSISAHFDAALYEEFLANPQENETYWTLRLRLNDIRTSTGALYVYTMRADEAKKAYIMIDGQPEGSVVASPINEPVMEEGSEYIDTVLEGKPASTPVVHDPAYGSYLSAYAPIRGVNGKIIGILGVDIEASDLEEIVAIVIQKSIPVFAGVAVLTIVALGFAYWITARTLRPLRDLTKAVSSIANGQFAQAEELLNQGKIRSQDEIGLLHQASHSMNRQLGAIMERLRTDVAQSSEQMAKASVDFADAAESLLKNATNIANTLQHAVSDAQTQWKSAEEAASSSEEMEAAVTKVSKAAAELSEAAEAVIQQAEVGTQSMHRVSQQIHFIAETSAQLVKIAAELEARSQNIGKVLGIITGLSSQTKMLALNASVEAARAGEHGRGFAVVAREVKSLAEQSAQSIESIRQLLGSIQEGASQLKQKIEEEAREISAGRTIAQNAADTFYRIVNVFRNVSGQIHDTSEAALQMSAGIKQTAASVAEISQIARKSSESLSQAASLVGKQLATSRNVAESAKRLYESADLLQTNLQTIGNERDLR